MNVVLQGYEIVLCYFARLDPLLFARHYATDADGKRDIHAALLARLFWQVNKGAGVRSPAALDGSGSNSKARTSQARKGMLKLPSGSAYNRLCCPATKEIQQHPRGNSGAYSRRQSQISFKNVLKNSESRPARWKNLKRPSRVYCRHCGAIPNVPSQCPSKYGEHAWEVLRG